jgi:hypothetical protein
MLEYGITTTSRENIGDTIVISYTANEWQLNNTSVTLSNYGIAISSGTVTVDDIIEINYIAQQTGVVLNSNPSKLLSIGLNQFDKDGTKIFSGYSIDNNGDIVSTSNNYVVYFKVTPETYTIELVTTGAATLGKIGFIETIPTTSSSVELLTAVSSSEWADSLINNTTRQHVLVEDEGYLCVSTPNIADLCCHLTWEGVNEGVYESYYEYSFNIPYSDANGTVITDYGLVNLDDTEEYYDELNLTDGKFYKRTARLPYSASNLATVQALDVPYMFDSNYIYYGVETVVYTLADNSNTYKVSNYGTEELVGSDMDLTVIIIYQDNLKDKLRFSAEVIDNKVNALNTSSSN